MKQIQKGEGYSRLREKLLRHRGARGKAGSVTAGKFSVAEAWAL